MDYFKDKVAIVTGAASGIGKALGEALARNGAVVILVDINAAVLEDVAESTIKAGYSTEAISLDVSNPARRCG